MSEEATTSPAQKTIPIYVWIVGALILLVAGWFGFRMLIAPFQEYRLILVDAPKEVNAGSIATFTWRVDGPPVTITHTAVHLGATSNPGELGKEIKPADTRYTDMVKDFASGTFNIPLQFVGNIQMGKPGTYYYRVHAIVGDKNYWTDEYTLEVKSVENAVTLITGPAEAFTGDVVTFTWRVDGPPNTINHTSVHFGTTSTPGTLGKNIKPANTAYKYLIPDFADGKFNIPLQFVGNTQIATPGAYFFRAHAIISGENYWTEERTVEVKRKPRVTTAPTEEEEEEEATSAGTESVPTAAEEL